MQENQDISPVYKTQKAPALAIPWPNLQLPPPHPGPRLLQAATGTTAT